MTNSKETRALAAFAAMSRIPNDYVLAAEQMLIEAEAGISRPPKPMGGFRRFLNSGWGAAVISGIVALAVLIFIIQAGVNPPATYEPPVKPAGSTIEMSDHGVNFTISTEQKQYPEGKGCITVIMTGKVKGEIISTPGGWHLERLTPEGAKVEEISYTEEMTFSAKPEKDAYATLEKTLYGTYTGGGFPAGTYRLHATRHDGEKYVSVAWCEFTVVSNETEPFPPTISPELPFTVTLTRHLYFPYFTEPGGLHLYFRANEPGVPLSRGDCWSIYRIEDGERIHMGSQIAEYAFEGEEVAPDEYAEESYWLSINKATGGNYRALPVGEYELTFDGYGMTFSFEVVDGPPCLDPDHPHNVLSSHIPYFVRRGYFINDGTHRYIIAELSPNMIGCFEFGFEAEAVQEKYANLNSGDYVEVLLGCSHEEVPSDTKSIYGIYKLEDGTVGEIPEHLRSALESGGIDLDKLQ